MKNRLQRFFDSRSPRQDQFRLSIKNIYVFFSRQGLLFLGLLIITFVAGVNYGNNLILGLFFYLLSIWLVSSVVTFLQLSSLQLSLQETTLTQAGELLWVTFKIQNTKGKPSRQIELSFYELDDKTFEQVGVAKKPRPIHQRLDKLPTLTLKNFMTHRKVTLSAIDQEVMVTLPVLTDSRGAVILPRLNIKSTYPLGVVQAWSYGFFAQTGFAYPAPIAFEDTTKTLTQSFDDNTSQFYRAGQDDFDRLDSYKDGESLARVSWSHFARGAGMLTKQFADPVGQTFSIDYQTMPASNHEEKLGQMTYALLALEGGQLAFRFVLPSGEWTGVGDEFIRSCLLYLAKEP